MQNDRKSVTSDSKKSQKSINESKTGGTRKGPGSKASTHELSKETQKDEIGDASLDSGSNELTSAQFLDSILAKLDQLEEDDRPEKLETDVDKLVAVEALNDHGLLSVKVNFIQ